MTAGPQHENREKSAALHLNPLISGGYGRDR
jgi:hypothetical protein